MGTRYGGNLPAVRAGEVRGAACHTVIVSSIKVIVEKHDDGYVAYPVGMKGVIVGEGDSYDAALVDVKSAILFHVETFGMDALGEESPVLDAFIVHATQAQR